MAISRFDRIALPGFWISLVLLAFLFGSCGNTRELVYLQGKFDTAQLSQALVRQEIIQKGDILSIIVFSDNPAATQIYNQPLISAATPGTNAGGGESAGGFGGPSTGGYLVDDQGNIEFQGLGRLHVDSLTPAQVKDTLNEKLKNLLTNPYFTVRFLNHRFTILGEIARPGIYNIPGDHLNLLEALGMAGDMTFYGRRDNILVVREINGKREFGRMDITKPEIMASTYFYLQTNDVVIIEPNKRKVVANDQVTLRNITIASTVISTLAILYSVFK